MAEVPEVESVLDAHLYVGQLGRMEARRDLDDPTDDDYFSAVYDALVEGIEDLDIDLDEDSFNELLDDREYRAARHLLERSLDSDQEEASQETGYISPEIGDDPFRPSGSI